MCVYTSCEACGHNRITIDTNNCELGAIGKGRDERGERGGRREGREERGKGREEGGERGEGGERREGQEKGGMGESEKYSKYCHFFTLPSTLLLKL